MATKVSQTHIKWNDLKTNVNRAEKLLSQEKLTSSESKEIVVLRGKIREGVNWISSIDFTASSKKSSNQLLAKSLNQAMLSTATKGDAVLRQLNQKIGSNKFLPVTATLAGLGVAGRYAYSYLNASTALVPFVPVTTRVLVPYVKASLTPYFLGAGAAIVLSLAAMKYYRSRSQE